MAVYASVNEICRQLAQATVELIEKVQQGCDDKIFLAAFQLATQELQNLVKFVQGYETAFTKEKKDLLANTLAVKNVVIKIITDLRTFHKTVPLSSSSNLP